MVGPRSRRNMVLLLASLVAVPVTLAQYVLGGTGPGRVLWQLACALLLPLMAYAVDRRQRLGAWRLFPVGLVALGPVVMLLDPPHATDVAMAVLLPLAMAMLFFDDLGVVVPVLLAGIASSAVFFTASGLPPREVTTLVVSLGGVGLVFSSSCYWLMTVRRHDLGLEHERSQALVMSESRRAQAERLAVVGRLASGVAHEINNPLSFVKANVNVLRRELYSSEPLSKEEALGILAETSAGIDRICQIVLDLKTFAREGKDDIEPTELKSVAESALRLASVRMPVGVALSCDIGHLPPVRANPRRLSQVLLNLLVNAGEALEEAHTPGPRVRVEGELLPGSGVALHIDDNGPGLSEAVLSRLFEPFFTTKPPGKGTGLGLALSREYLSAFDATIRASNLPGGGARFTLTLREALDLSPTPVPTTPTEAPSGSPPPELSARAHGHLPAAASS